METYQGFKVLKFKFSPAETETCEFFMKPHNVREYNMKKPGGRTLFIINIPSYITKEAIRSMMKRFGKVVDVFLHKKPNSKAPPDIKYPLLNPEIATKGYKVSYVVFLQSSSVKKAMSAPADHIYFGSSDKMTITTGLKKWQKEYDESFHSEDALRREVELIMRDYDDRKTREKESQSNEPDEDGWTTVNSSQKLKRKAPDEKAPAPKRKRRKKVQLNDFYAFQRKEINMKHLEDKRKKFEEDGKRMALLRSSRKFKPH